MDDVSAFLSGGDDKGPDYGPEFTAQYDSECSYCYWPITEGDLARATGEGDYIHSECLGNWLRENA